MRPACASRLACLVGWVLPVVGTPDADHRRRRCCHLVESVFPPIRGCSHQSLVRCRVGFQVAAVVLDAEVPLVVSVRQDERVHLAGLKPQDGLERRGDLALRDAAERMGHRAEAEQVSDQLRPGRHQQADGVVVCPRAPVVVLASVIHCPNGSAIQDVSAPLPLVWVLVYYPVWR